METPQEQNGQDSITFIEPTQLFVSLKMRIGEDKFDREISVTELVYRDQVLFEFSDPEQFSTDTCNRQPIETDETCYSSEDQNTIYSSIIGYPRRSYTPSPELRTSILHISVEPLFRIAADRMKASLSIHPPVPHGHSLADVDLRRLLATEGITSGLVEENIRNAEEIIEQHLHEFNVIIIALGKKPVHGTDAYLRFEVETGPIPGKVLADGSIDFRERKIFVPVSKGQIIATKIPPTVGTSGKNVFGEYVTPKPGNDITVSTLKDSTYSAKNRQVTATADGVLSVVGDTIIKVCSRQEIMGDIDYNTGHVESRNSVIIHGSVQPGFKVATDGDLEIRGSVMSTAITSHGNIVIKSGITGKKSVIKADGDVDFYFVEQGQVQSGSNCIIRKQSYYTNIIAGKHIRCPRTSYIVGGQVFAAGNLTLGNIGSPNASPAHIGAGVDGNRLEQYKTLQKSLINQQETLIQWLQMHKGTATAKKIRKMEKKVEETKLQLLRMNLIPGSGLYSRAGEKTDSAQLKGRQYSRKDAIDISTITIEIHGIVFAGTKIQIGNRIMILEHTIANRLFKLNDSLTEVAAFPLRKR